MKQFHFREVGGGWETIFSFGVALWFNKLMDLEYLQVDKLIQKLPVGTSQGFKLKALAFTLKCRQSSLRY